MIPFCYKTYNPLVPKGIYGDATMIMDLFSRFVEIVDDIKHLNNCVLMVRGSENASCIDEINKDIEHLDKCLIIVTGNEDHKFRADLIDHKNCEVWLQTPGYDDNASKFLPFGYPTVIENIVKDVKSIDWFFAGQVTHNRRKDCVQFLQSMKVGRLGNSKNGILLETKGFNQGFDYDTYIDYMSKSKIAVCPGGAITPDTFRVYEALECGTVPIVDISDGTDSYKNSTITYWEKVFGTNPFPVVNNWKDLPEIIDDVLTNYNDWQDRTQYFWAVYKSNLKQDFIKFMGV